MIYLNNNPFIFFHRPRTAGTSITLSIVKGLSQSLILSSYHNLGIECESVHSDLNGKDNPHSPPLRYLVDFLDFFGNKNYWNTSFKFTFVRNPYDWIISFFYYYKNNEDLRQFATAREWVMSWINLPPYITTGYQWCYYDREPLVNFVGRFERLKSDYRYICKRLNIEDYLYEFHARKNIHPSPKQILDKKSADRIYEFFQDDFEVFGYSREWTL